MISTGKRRRFEHQTILPLDPSSLLIQELVATEPMCRGCCFQAQFKEVGKSTAYGLTGC